MHPVAYFIGAILLNHDRRGFEIFCYSTGHVKNSMTENLKKLTDHWREIRQLDDDAAAELIVRDRIDVLVDLSGHTRGNRLLVFARKPAPVQMTYLGYPDTTGLDTIEYRITDEHADPPGISDEHSTETLLRMAGGFLAYQAAANAPAVGPLPSEASGSITFGSFNNLAKLSDETIALWARVLHAVPQSRLVLKARVFSDAGTRALIHERLVGAGYPPARFELLGESPDMVAQLSAYAQIDIALDPTPYNGTTTTCEALWMGVPVVTLTGDRHSGRVGTSILHAAGLPGLIAADEDDYVRIAVGLAEKRAGLASLRARLRTVLARSPLLKHRRMTRELEQAYREAWQKWCAKVTN